VPAILIAAEYLLTKGEAHIVTDAFTNTDTIADTITDT
jgi:hypothetical protein